VEEPLPQAAGLSLKDMALSARLPEVKAPLPEPSTIAILPDREDTETLAPPERIGRGDRPRGVPEGTRLDGGVRLPPPFFGAERPVPDRLKDLRSRLIQEEIRKSWQARPTNEEIRGPVAARELVFRPAPPKAPEGAEGEVELKFWVLPDGTVGRVLLLRRGNLALETAAFQNLQQWKFNSLPPGAEVPEQWGIVRFRFLSAAAKTPRSPQ